MTYGIDKEISDRADVYASNPQALGFQYKKSGSVLDLIALKRIKDDLDKKRQEIALQYGQKAEQQKTIAEQTLDEVKTGIQGDVVKHTSDVLAQKKGTQDARLRKVAAGRRPNAPLGIPAAAQAQRRGAPNQQLAGIGNIPPRSPVNPRGRGIAANRLPSTAYAARGGIVSFQNTGLVTDKPHQKLSAAALEKLGYSLPEWSKLSADEQQRVVEVYRAFEAGELGDMDPANIREIYSFEGKPRTRMQGLQQVDVHGFPNKEEQLVDPFGRVTGTGRDPYPDVNILPPDADAVAAAEEPVVPGAAPPAPPAPPAPEAVDPLATIDRSILDPLTDVGLPTSTVEYQDPFETVKGRQVVENQEALQDWQAGERARDPVAERAATAAWTDLQTGKQGIADLNARQVAARKALQEEQAGQREQNRFADITAFARGRGPLADMSRGAYGMRQANYDRIERELMGIQGLEQYGQEQTTAAGKLAVEAGIKQMEMTEAARTEAGRSETQLLKQQGDQLSDTAKQYLEAGKANQTEQGQLRNDKVQLAIKKVDAKVKLSIADREYVISKEANDLRKMAITSQDMRTLTTAQVDIDEKLGALAAKYQKMAADAYQATEYGVMGIKDKQAYKAQLDQQFFEAENIARAELLATKKMIEDKLRSMIAALPPENSASKFTNVRQTSP